MLLRDAYPMLLLRDGIFTHINPVYEHKQDLINCTKKILASDDIKSESTLSQANGHLQVFKSYSFNFWLTFFSKIMPFVGILFGQLQRTNIDPSTANMAILSL